MKNKVMTNQVILNKMPLQRCPHEPEVKALLERGQWPTTAPAELRTHTAGCRTCSNLALLTTTFRADRAQATAQAQLPPPGLLWWRAQLHRRNQALARINRPLVSAQLFALVTLATTLITFIFVMRTSIHNWLDERTSTPATPSPSHLLAQASTSANEWVSTSWTSLYLPFLIGFALIVLAGGAALYLSSERT